MSDPRSEAALTTTLVTRTGQKLRVRPVRPQDRERLRAMFEHLSPEDLRFRFLTAVPHISDLQLDRLTENFLAFDDADEQLVASAMLAADASMETAEVAISIDEDWKG